MLEIEIKSDLMKTEIIQLLNLLKDSGNIYSLLRNMFFSIKKIDHLHDKRLRRYIN